VTLSAYSQQDLDRISHRINTMPRRLHRWDSAQDRYDAAVVALTAWIRPSCYQKDLRPSALPQPSAPGVRNEARGSRLTVVTKVTKWSRQQVSAKQLG
jgi:hypothetical protein